MKKENKDKQINIRLSEKDKELLDIKAQKYNKSYSQLVVEMIHTDERKDYIYNLPVMRYLIKMTDIVVNEVPKLTKDPELLKTCREVGEGIWQYLQ